jgi:hypothetical protein
LCAQTIGRAVKRKGRIIEGETVATVEATGLGVGPEKIVSPVAWKRILETCHKFVTQDKATGAPKPARFVGML